MCYCDLVGMETAGRAMKVCRLIAAREVFMKLIRCRFLLIALLALTLFPIMVSGQAGQTLNGFKGFGIDAHLADPPAPETVKVLADMGVRWVREGVLWGMTERSKGQYDFGRLDRMVAALAPYNIRPILILCYRNALYDGGQSPSTDAGRQAFVQWTMAAVHRFQGRGFIWEMYNEPNEDFFWRPKANVQDYIKLATAVGEAFRQNTPGEVLIGPAISTFDYLPFVEACLQGGLLRYWSAVSVHPYRLRKIPETVIPDFRALRSLIVRYAPPGKQVAMISSEWGYPSVGNGVNEDLQAKFLARQWLATLASDVAVSDWYDLYDDGADPNNPTQHMGLISGPHVKPAYYAARACAKFVGSESSGRPITVGGSDVYVVLFGDGRATRVAAWTTSSEPRKVVIPVKAGRYSVTNYMGGEQPAVTASNNGLPAVLTDGPQYFVPE